MTIRHIPGGRRDHTDPGDAAPPHTMGEGTTVSPHHAFPGVRLYTGDTLAVLRCLPTASVDCAVTAPPPWTPRDDNPATWTGCGPSHGHAPSAVVRGNRWAETAGCAAGSPSDIEATGYDSSPGPSPPGSHHRYQPNGTALSAGGSPFGLEPTATGYVDRLRTVFAELRRVLTPAGTAWLSLGDSYSATSGGHQCAWPGQPRHPDCRPPAVPPGNLLGLPWRVALALQADGWILRNAVAWHTPASPTPAPAGGRLTTRYELLFLLAAQQRYFFDLDPIREPYTGDRPLSRRTHRGGTTPRAAQGARSPWPPPARPGRPGGVGRGRNPGDVWAIPTRPAHPDGQPPGFPVEVALRAIAAGCPPDGVVLDPFSTTGTTGIAARQLGRRYLGIDPDPASATAR